MAVIRRSADAAQGPGALSPGWGPPGDRTWPGQMSGDGHRRRVLAWYDHKISTGPLGTNTKIRAMRRKACGFRDTEFFKLKICALHQTKYALVG